ncbi:MAG TPA: PAS domain-containing protein, partial [Herpetosiphonaceae bacterium]
MSEHSADPGSSPPAPGASADDLRRRLAEAEAALAEAREREYYHQALLASSSDGIWRFELREPVDIGAPAAEQIAAFYACGVLAECNQALARMYGFEEPAEILGRPLGEFLVESDPANTDYLASFIGAGYRLVDALSHET